MKIIQWHFSKYCVKIKLKNKPKLFKQTSIINNFNKCKNKENY